MMNIKAIFQLQLIRRFDVCMDFSLFLFFRIYSLFSLFLFSTLCVFHVSCLVFSLFSSFPSLLRGNFLLFLSRSWSLFRFSFFFLSLSYMLKAILRVSLTIHIVPKLMFYLCTLIRLLFTKRKWDDCFSDFFSFSLSCDTQLSHTQSKTLFCWHLAENFQVWSKLLEELLLILVLTHTQSGSNNKSKQWCKISHHCRNYPPHI